MVHFAAAIPVLKTLAVKGLEALGIEAAFSAISSTCRKVKPVSPTIFCTTEAAYATVALTTDDRLRAETLVDPEYLVQDTI